MSELRGTVTDSIAAANALTERWVQSAVDGSSTVLAAAGVWPLLAALAAAAAGPARSALVQACGIAAGDGMQRSGELLEALRRSSAVTAAVGLWAAAELPVHDSWRRQLPADSWGELRHDGSDQERLDSWARSATQGLIPALPVKVTEKTLLLLASALAVRTRWHEPFEEMPLRAVESGPWSGLGPVPMLSRFSADLDDLRVLTDADAGEVSLIAVHGEGDISVHLALGGAAASPAAVLRAAVHNLMSPNARLGSELDESTTAPGVSVRSVPSFSAEPALHLWTVPFRVTAEHDLLSRAELFGLISACDPDHGHFPQISTTPLCIEQARQSAMAAFSAEGFEAAAVTAISAMRAGMAMPAGRRREVTLSIDRPFGFLAVDRVTGLVLVAGWVAEPAQATASEGLTFI